MQGKKNGVPQCSKVGILLLDIDLTECVGLGIEFDNPHIYEMELTNSKF